MSPRSSGSLICPPPPPRHEQVILFYFFTLFHIGQDECEVHDKTIWKLISFFHPSVKTKFDFSSLFLGYVFHLMEGMVKCADQDSGPG